MVCCSYTCSYYAHVNANTHTQTHTELFISLPPVFFSHPCICKHRHMHSLCDPQHCHCNRTKLNLLLNSAILLATVQRVLSRPLWGRLGWDLQCVLRACVWMCVCVFASVCVCSNNLQFRHVMTFFHSCLTTPGTDTHTHTHTFCHFATNASLSWVQMGHTCCKTVQDWSCPGMRLFCLGPVWGRSNKYPPKVLRFQWLLENVSERVF